MTALFIIIIVGLLDIYFYCAFYKYVYGKRWSHIPLSGFGAVIMAIIAKIKSE